LRTGRWRDLDNNSSPIVHLPIPGEVAYRVEERLDDLLGCLMTVGPYCVERALDAELAAVRGEGFHHTVCVKKDQVAWRQSDRHRAGKVRVWKQAER
jgi:hypothetical protein